MHNGRMIRRIAPIAFTAVALAFAACGSSAARTSRRTPGVPDATGAAAGDATLAPQPIWRIAGFSFVSPRQGWLVRTDGSVAGGGSQALATLDGGDTWTVQPNATEQIPLATSDATSAAIAEAPCSPARQLSMLNQSVGWALCSGAGASGLVQGGLYETTDGARTWHPVSQFAFGDPTPAPGVGKLPGAGGHFQFLDATHGWLTTGDHGPYIYSTTDAGHTWQRFQTPLSDSLEMLDFIDAEHGWVANGTQLARTTDGGAHWTTLTLP